MENFLDQTPKLPGLKIVGKIDLASYEEDKRRKVKPEKYNEQLDGLLRQMAESANAAYGHLLNDDGSICMDDEDYTFLDKEDDHQEIKDCELFFARKANKSFEMIRKEHRDINKIVVLFEIL